ncbi:MAG: histone deacetylase family protein, partial [Candidatus Natronoplasma sp.]
MKVIYHPYFTDSDYSLDPAAEEGRIKCILEELKSVDGLDFVEPKAVSREQLELVHDPHHIENVKQRGDKLYRMSKLSAGGALLAGKSAYEKDPSFAVIRPPGHHASPDSSWGFCYFNNMAVTIENLRFREKIKSAFIMDFDLHLGDGNINCLGEGSNIEIVNPSAEERADYLEKVENYLEEANGFDILGVSAGFDQHIEDWGG